MKTPHKHAELIKAWADGATIEWYESLVDRWYTCDIAPMWRETGIYRIKPESKPDVVVNCVLDVKHPHRYTQIKCQWVGSVPAGYAHNECGLQLIYDGETGKLKDAKVL